MISTSRAILKPCSGWGTAFWRSHEALAERQVDPDLPGRRLDHRAGRFRPHPPHLRAVADEPGGGRADRLPPAAGAGILHGQWLLGWLLSGVSPVCPPAARYPPTRGSEPAAGWAAVRRAPH